MYAFRQISLILVLLLFSSACQKTDKKEPISIIPAGARSVIPEASLYITSSSDMRKLNLRVAIADEETERNTGLMDVHNLDDSTGMIFIFDLEQPLSFWMANTPLALDMMFINANYEIVTIHRNTQPYAETQFSSDKPAKYVLEVRGGLTLEKDINVGDIVKWKKDNE